jgi:transposase-like protein
VRKRQRRLSRVEDLVVSLVGKGLTTGKVQAHVAARAHRDQEPRVGDVCIVVCDGRTGLPDAISTAWPRAVTQTCIVHLLRNSFRYASRRDWAALAKDLRPDLHRRRPKRPHTTAWPSSRSAGRLATRRS